MTREELKFKIQDSNTSDKRIFLGKFSTNNKIVSAVSGIRIYLFDVNNKIIEV